MIELKNVTKSHLRGQTRVDALRGISCRIESGSFNFILGPSGSGKSTLLYLIGALDSPTSGEIIVDDRNLNEFTDADRDAYRRDDVGFIFQSFNLLGNLDAVENVLVPYLPQGRIAAHRDRAVSLLREVGLGDRLDHRPNQLSGGEQQRVAIARALLKQPRLILADEPTGELDSQTGKEVFAQLRNLTQKQETTVIVVTHDESFQQSDDCVLRIHDGLLQESEQPAT